MKRGNGKNLISSTKTRGNKSSVAVAMAVEKEIGGMKSRWRKGDGDPPKERAVRKLMDLKASTNRKSEAESPSCSREESPSEAARGLGRMRVVSTVIFTHPKCKESPHAWALIQRRGGRGDGRREEEHSGTARKEHSLQFDSILFSDW